MTALYQSALTDLSDTWRVAAQTEIVSWQGREALKLEGGLLLWPDLPRTDARVEVLVGAGGPAYPGVAFCAAGPFNKESHAV